jgi:hypothetical protein
MVPRPALPPLAALAACAALGAACGGGGGGGGAAPVGDATRLAADAAEIAPAALATELLVRLARSPAVAPTLLELAVVLPPQLVLPAGARLQAAAPLANLDGDVVGNRFVVLCGDAQNEAAAPLAVGPLFRLRLQAASPRQPGEYTVRLESVRAASRTGEALPVDPAPVDVRVTVR